MNPAGHPSPRRCPSWPAALLLLSGAGELPAQPASPAPSDSAPTGVAIAVAGTYRTRLGGDLGTAPPAGGESGPGAELVGRYRFRRGVAVGVGLQHAWLTVEEGASGDASLLEAFAELGHAFVIEGARISPRLGGRLGYAVESRSGPEPAGTRRAKGLDLGGFGGARLPLSDRLALDGILSVSFVIVGGVPGARDRSGQALTFHLGVEYSVR